MGDGCKSKEKNYGSNKAKAVSEWAKATAYSAKALVAVVGLITLIIFTLDS